MSQPNPKIVKMTFRAVSYQPTIERFEAQYMPEPNSGCWIWVGSATGPASSVRPKIYIEGKSRNAHRFSYEYFVGPIPSGLLLRHTCHNTFCVNPEHLIPGTHKDNADDMMRAGRHFSQNGNHVAMAALRGRILKISKAKLLKPTCSKGHLLDDDNMYAHPSGRRVCRKCRIVWKRNFRTRQKGVSNA